LSNRLADTCLNLFDEGGAARFEERGEMPLILDGQTGYRDFCDLTLRDLPAMLDTLVVLEAEAEERLRADSERKAAELKEPDRTRTRESRQRKKQEAAGVTFIDKPRGYRNKHYPVEKEL
jgi:hypothetical protein